MSSNKTKKALLIGLDGVPYSLLQTYLDKGVMPNLKRILTQGFRLTPMNASIPDISSVSWTSFATGVNPGEHGIFGFTDLKPETYALVFPNARDIRAPSFWEILGKTSTKTSSLFQKYGKLIERPYRSIILNMPHTYPAGPMHGTLVSGFVAIDLKKAVFPESVYPLLRSMDYLIDVDAEKAKEDKTLFLKELNQCLEIRQRAISHFFREEPWDLFFACITETDRLHHFFFNAANDPGDPFHDPFLRFYEALDNTIRALYTSFTERFPDGGYFMVLSDHGFASINKEVYLNPFLQEKGFLELTPDGMFYERIKGPSKAFDLDPCRIYLNDRDRYGRGTVRKEDRAHVLREIKEALRGLKDDDGTSVIDAIYEKEEIYHGPCFQEAPDLVCLPRDGYDLKGGIQKKGIFGKEVFMGMHTWHDAFCLLPETVPFSQKPSIDQLAEPLLQYFTQ